MSRGWALVFVAAGVLLLIYGIGLVREARSSGNWPSVLGKVVSAETTVVGHEKNKSIYAPQVVYRYVVEGREHESSRLALVPRNSSSRAQVEAWIAPYVVGSEVKVFYDPANPGEGVLDPKARGSEPAYAIAGVILLGLGAWHFFRR